MNESKVKNLIGGTILIACLYILCFTEYGFEDIVHRQRDVSDEIYFPPPEIPRENLFEEYGSDLFQADADDTNLNSLDDFQTLQDDEEFMKQMENIPVNLHRADFDEEFFIQENEWKRILHGHRKYGPREFIHDEKWELEHQITVEKVGSKHQGKAKYSLHKQTSQKEAPQDLGNKLDTVHKRVQTAKQARIAQEEDGSEVSARGWEKYSQQKQVQSNDIQTNTSQLAKSAVGMDTDMVELLAQLEQEVARLRGQLHEIDGQHQGGIDDSVLSEQKPKPEGRTGDNEYEEEEEDAPLITVLNVDDKSQVSKSHDTLTKGVQTIPTPVFLKQFNNPCFIEQIDEDTTRRKYIKKVIRSCDRIRSFYPKYDKAMQVISDVPVQVFDRTGLLTGDFRLRCIPYFYLLGFPKCGTTDLRSRLMLHNYIKDAVCKEPQYWDRRRFQKDVTYADYLDLFNLGTQRILNTEVNDYNPMILGDFSTRTIGNEYYWERYEGNAGLSEPSYLSAHEIHHLNPSTKFIVSMRNPTERLYSDYMHFKHVSAEDFHRHVVASIEWWRACVKAHPLRQCLYGVPADMPPLDPPGDYWSTEPTAQIRTGFYYYFIIDWLDVFEREQFLFVEFKDYVVDEAGYITDVILPFLNMGPLSAKTEKVAERKTKANARNTHSGKAKVDMFPETRQLLDHFYTPFNNKLAELLGDDKYKWHLREGQ